MCFRIEPHGRFVRYDCSVIMFTKFIVVDNVITSQNLLGIFSQDAIS